MRNLLKPLISSVLIAVAVAPVAAAPPAHGVGTMAAALLGSGLVSPGLTVAPATHQWQASLMGPAVGLVGAGLPGDLACTVSWGTLVKEDLGAGAGQGTYYCFTSGSSSTWSGVIYVARTGTVVSLGFVGFLVGTVSCVMIPVQLPPAPVSQYTLTCAGAAAGI